MDIDPRLCILCRGTKYLCGLTYCPVFIRRKISLKIPKDLDGSSPPSVFVGRLGYPKVNVFASSPPVKGDTSIYEDSKKWLNINLDEFLTLRLSMARGGEKFRVNDANNPPKLLDEIKALSLSPSPAEVEMKFKYEPRNAIFDEDHPPLGPSAPVENIRIGTLPPPEKPVEKVFQDKDLKSSEGIIYLYKLGFDVERISRILSVGNMGVKRRLVPTRWSITAVDKIVSDNLVNGIKKYDSINKIEVYTREFNRNLFVAILLPRSWSFEWGEAWFPGSTWNKFGKDIGIEVDNEGYFGRKDYPAIGGCYYASRLAVSEFLLSRKRQATAILWREIYSGFNLPVGVWFVRENVRELFKTKPKVFDSLEDALISIKLKSGLNSWIKRSSIKRETIERWLS